MILPLDSGENLLLALLRFCWWINSTLTKASCGLVVQPNFYQLANQNKYNLLVKIFIKIINNKTLKLAVIFYRFHFYVIIQFLLIYISLSHLPKKKSIYRLDFFIIVKSVSAPEIKRISKWIIEKKLLLLFQFSTIASAIHS